MSVVQEYALEIILILEERQRVADFRDRLKMALIAHDSDRYSRLMFPEWFGGVETKVEVPVEDFNPSDTTGEWKFTSEMGEEDVVDVLRSLGQVPVTLGAGDVPDGGWQ